MRRDIWIPLGIYAGCVALASLLWSTPLVLAGGYLLISAGMLWRWHTKADVAFYAVPLVVGPLGEALAVWAGAWAYARPSYLGIPCWLPLLWGIVGLFLKRFCDALRAPR